MLVRRQSQIAMTTKADRPGYEFSGKLALPGGLIRGAPGEEFGECLRRSVFQRVHLESGLPADALHDVEFACVWPSPVSGYTVKGQERRTAVLVVHARANAACELSGVDLSVKGADWYDIPPPWGRIAPANRLILAGALANELSVAEHVSCAETIDDAHRQCTGWAADVGLPSAAHPFERLRNP